MAKMIIAIIAGVIVLAALVVFNDNVLHEVDNTVFQEPVIANATAPTRRRVKQIGGKVKNALGVRADTGAQNSSAPEQSASD